ncbi:hypothetical protein A5782_17120 [Mycobacterium sp. 852002-40037_SCH5390672]|nr:hypothetical protein A5782_17120 [Mycobacterium sp. 852002-40037_SCH5390672]
MGLVQHALSGVRGAFGWGLGVILISRPILWLVGIVPFFGGYVLATHRIAPVGCLHLQAASCWSEGWQFGVVVLIMGPSCWLFAFVVNDIVDLPGDRNDPTRARSPLVTGSVPLPVAKLVAAASAVLAIAAGAVAGPVFAAMAVVALTISWAYSAPPLRFKNRPGCDIAVCSFAVGGCPLIVGYVLGAPLSTLPWISPLVGTLYMVAIYVPTTIGDYESDLANGNTTVAVRFGRDRTYWVGLVAVALVCTIYAVLAAMNYIIPRQLLSVEVVAGVTTIAAYHKLLYKAYDPKAIVHRLALIGVIAATAMFLFSATYIGLF